MTGTLSASGSRPELPAAFLLADYFLDALPRADRGKILRRAVSGHGLAPASGATGIRIAAQDLRRGQEV